MFCSRSERFPPFPFAAAMRNLLLHPGLPHSNRHPGSHSGRPSTVRCAARLRDWRGGGHLSDMEISLWEVDNIMSPSASSVPTLASSRSHLSATVSLFRRSTRSLSSDLVVRTCQLCTVACDNARPDGCTHPCPVGNHHRGACDPCPQRVHRDCFCGATRLRLACADVNGASPAAVEALLSCGSVCHRRMDACPHLCDLTSAPACGCAVIGAFFLLELRRFPSCEELTNLLSACRLSFLAIGRCHSGPCRPSADCKKKATVRRCPYFACARRAQFVTRVGSLSIRV